MREPCPECGALVTADPGPTHAYVPASPGCWKAFAEVQADELARFGYPPTHGLVVDAYMAQHPGDGRERRARQSVVLHLIALCATLEHGATRAERVAIIRRALENRPDFPALPRPASQAPPTVLDMFGASDVDDYRARAEAWATAVWDAWVDQQSMIRARVELLRAR